MHNTIHMSIKTSRSHFTPSTIQSKLQCHTSRLLQFTSIQPSSFQSSYNHFHFTPLFTSLSLPLFPSLNSHNLAPILNSLHPQPAFHILFRVSPSLVTQNLKSIDLLPSLHHFQLEINRLPSFPFLPFLLKHKSIDFRNPF